MQIQQCPISDRPDKKIRGLTEEEQMKFSKGFIHVDRTISHGKASPFLKERTKTKAGERDVPISAVLKPLLEEALGHPACSS